MHAVKKFLPAKAKKVYRALFRHPRGVKFGVGSGMLRPWAIEGPSYIEIGNESFIREDANISAFDQWKDQRFSPRIRIGNNVYIGRHLFMTSITGISIGDGCVLSDYVYITDSFHGMHPEHGLIMEQQWESKGPVSIGPHCFIGFRACIMPGVTLGPHCIVGVNSVVTKSFDGYVVLGGVPARVLKVFSKRHNDWVPPELADDLAAR